MHYLFVLPISLIVDYLRTPKPRPRFRAWLKGRKKAGDGIVVTNLENQPFFENLLEHFATSVDGSLISPNANQSGNLAEVCAVVESLEPGSLHRHGA